MFQYGLTLLELHLGMYACFDVKMKYPWRQLIGALICVLLSVWIDFPVSITADITATIVTLISVRQKEKKSWYQVVILAVLLSGLNEMIDGPRSLYQVLNGVDVQQTDVMVLINRLSCCVFLLFIGFIRKKIPENAREKLLTWIRGKIPFMLIIVVINMLMIISFLGFVTQYIHTRSLIKLLGFFEIISFLNILLLICFVLYIWETDRKMVLLNKRMENYHKAEKTHYEMLLKNAKETRKYHHDMKNHLVCMEQMAEKEAWGELKSYLSGITGLVKNVPVSYETGQLILDIITNYLLSEERTDAEINIYGGVETIGKICQEDLCTIYANLLQNAVDELQRKEDGERGFLKIWFSENKKFLQIEMENSLSGSKNDLQTHKNEKDLHGFGIGNVREAVKKNDGEMEIEIREKTFYISVILPLDYYSTN